MSYLLRHCSQAKFVIGLSPSDVEDLDATFENNVNQIARLLTNVPVLQSIGILYNDYDLKSNETRALAETYVTNLISGLANETSFSAIASEVGLSTEGVPVINWGDLEANDQNPYNILGDLNSLISSLQPVKLKEADAEMENWVSANCSWETILNEIGENFKNQLPQDVSLIVAKIQEEFEEDTYELVCALPDGHKYARNYEGRCHQIINFTRDSSQGSKDIFDLFDFLDDEYGIVREYGKEFTNMAKYVRMYTHNSSINISSSWVGYMEKFAFYCQNLITIISFLKQFMETVDSQKLSEIPASALTHSSVLDKLQSRGIIPVDHEVRQSFENYPKFVDCLLKHVHLHSQREVKITCEKSELKANISFNPMKLLVVGNYVKFSDFLSNENFGTHSHPNWDRQCDETNVKELHIFASEAAYLDMSLNATGLELDVTIIAPILHVINDNSRHFRHVTLNGKDVPELEPNPFKLPANYDWDISERRKRETEITYKKADDGESDGANGANGKAGETGQNGGTFLAVFNKMTNSRGLQVDSVGGNGGDGQDGGDGRDGQRGRSVTREDFRRLPRADTIISEVADGSSGVIYGGEIHGKNFYPNLDLGFLQMRSIIGEQGPLPGNGGKGGDAGLPGRGGTLTLVNTGTELVKPKLYAYQGTFGKPGVGGTNGRRIRGHHMVCKSYRLSHLGCQTKENILPWPPILTTSEGGSAPTSNLKLTPVSSKTTTARAMVQYKDNFFRERLAKHWFMKEMDTHPKLLPYTSPLSIAEDLTNLEERYYTTGYRKDAEFETLFSLLSARIIEYVNFSANQTASGLSTSDRYALSYIYAASLSKLSALRDDQRNGTVINTAHFFANLRTQLGYLKEAKQAEIVEAQCGQFQATLNVKVEETMGFIYNTVMPAVDQVEQSMNNASHKMVGEMNDKLQTSKDNLEKAEQAKRDFESMAIWRALFGIIKVVASFASFLGPVGQTVGGLVTTAAGVIEPLALGPVTNPTLNVPNDFETALANNLQPMMEDRAKTIGAFVDDTKLALAEKKTELAAIMEKVDQLEANQKAFKDAVSDPEVTAVDVMEIEMQMNGKMQELDNVIKTEKDKVETAMQDVEETSSNLEKAERKAQSKTLENALGKVGAGIQVAKAGFEVYQTIIQNADTADRLQENINRARKHVELIEKKKVVMYNAFMPMFKSIAPSVKKGAQSLSGVSQGGLKVKQWQVKSGLQSVRREVEGFTKGMNIGEEMKLCVEKLMEAMTLLIDLYDHIEAYEEKKQLANYIANVNSPSAKNVLIEDSELRQMITKLEAATKANFLLGEYHRGLHAFKKWAFPFGKRYLDSDKQLTDMSALLGTNQNLTQAADIYMQKVLILSDQLQRYNASTSSEHEMIRVSHFKTGLNGIVPFFYWRQEDWKETIGQLFAGKAVQLPASLMYSSNMGLTPGENGLTAVKYRDIELVVTARNANEQLEVDQLLSHFRVSFTHSGISNYQFAGRKYVIRDNSVTYEHSFEKVGNTMAFVTENMARHLQTQRGNCLMSPFTMWNVQLYDALPASGLNMSHLPSIAEKVDLSLQGHGVFIDENRVDKTALEALGTSSFYESYDSEP